VEAEPARRSSLVGGRRARLVSFCVCSHASASAVSEFSSFPDALMIPLSHAEWRFLDVRPHGFRLNRWLPSASCAKRCVTVPLESLTNS